MTIKGDLKKGRPLPWVWVIGSVIVVILVGLFIFDPSDFRDAAGLLLLGIFVLGIVLALAASVEKGNRGKVWGELGRSLLVAGLMSFAVWLIGDLRRPAEAHHALQLSLGVQRQMPGVDLHSEDLSRFDLAGKNLEGANMEDADLTGASLVRTNLAGAELASADLAGANLEEANLSGADLSDADLAGTEASRVNLRNSKLLGTDLSGAQLNGANMRGVCLAGGSLADAYLPDAHLDRAALTGADLQGAKFWFDLRPAYLGAVGLAHAEHASEARWPPAFEPRVEKLVTPAAVSFTATVKTTAHGTGTGTVLAVPDGDTVLLATAAGQKAARLIGIDTPDLDEPAGMAARQLLRKQLPIGAHVRFEYDHRRVDNFKRQLLYIYGAHGLVNQLELQHGTAVASIDPPSDGLRNVRYARRFLEAESWARRHALGLWAACPP